MSLTPLQTKTLLAVQAGLVFVPCGLGELATENWFTWDGPRLAIPKRTVESLLRRNLVATGQHDDVLDKVGLTEQGQTALARRAVRRPVRSGDARIDAKRIEATSLKTRMRLARAELWVSVAASHAVMSLADSDVGEEIAARYGLTAGHLARVVNQIGDRIEKHAIADGYDQAWVDLDPDLNLSAA